MDPTLRRLPGLLAKTPCALIFINNLSQLPAKTDGYPLAHFAALRLLIEKEEWLVRRSDGDIAGYQARVRVLKNKFGPEGKETSIRIKFNGTVEGDGA
jgi:RecA/RadA recombinase